MGALDGHVHRALEGKTVKAIAKDGLTMTVWCTNGEQWHIGWADFVAGRGLAGEPSIVAIDDLRLASGPTEAPDGGLHAALAGRTIESARTDGTLLLLQCVDGRRYGVAWVDPATQERVNGEPCLIKVDARLQLEGVSAFGEARM